CWLAFGLHKSDPRLITLGTTGVTASALMLARIRHTGNNRRRACYPVRGLNKGGDASIGTAGHRPAVPDPTGTADRRAGAGRPAWRLGAAERMYGASALSCLAPWARVLTVSRSGCAGPAMGWARAAGAGQLAGPDPVSADARGGRGWGVA